MTAGIAGFERDPSAIAIPEGDFAYGAPQPEADPHLPGPDWFAGAEWHAQKVPDFIDAMRLYATPDQTAEHMRVVMDMLGSADVDQVAIFEAPFETWAKDAGAAELIRELYRTHSDKNPKDVIRDDTKDADDPYGAKIWAAMVVRRFLLVDRCTLSQTPQGTVVMRRLEAVETSDPRQALWVVNQLSLREVVRLDWLLDQWQASPGERAYVHANASRLTVQSDQDVESLIEGHSRISALLAQWQATPDEYKYFYANARLGVLQSDQDVEDLLARHRQLSERLAHEATTIGIGRTASQNVASGDPPSVTLVEPRHASES